MSKHKAPRKMWISLNGSRIINYVWINNPKSEKLPSGEVIREYTLKGVEQRAVCRRIKETINKECFLMTYNGVTKSLVLAEDLLEELKRINEAR